MTVEPSVNVAQAFVLVLTRREMHVMAEALRHFVKIPAESMTEVAESTLASVMHGQIDEQL